MIFDIPSPIGGRISGISHRQDMKIWSVTQGFDDFKGRCFLPFKTVGVDGIDNGNPWFCRQFPDQLQTLIKVALQSDHDCAINERLGEFTPGDFSGWQENGTLNAGARRSSTPWRFVPGFRREY